MKRKKRKNSQFNSNESSSSSSKKNENSHSAPAGLNLKTRVLPRKSQGRQAGFISGGTVNGLLKSEIRQRILSARQHRQKSLQSQLTLALQQNAVQTIRIFLCSEKLEC